MSQVSAAGAWQRFASSLNSSELFEIEAEFRDLEDHPGFKRLCDIIDKGEKNSIRSMTRGHKPLEHAEYARQAGYIEGLNEFREGISTLLAEAEKERAARAKESAAKRAESERQAREVVPV